MTTLVRGTTTLAVLMLFASACGLLKKKGAEDAGAEASVAEVADAETTPTPAPLATNEGDIARFPDEVKLANVAATVQRTYNVREAPPAGAVVAGLTKGTLVTQVAQREKYFLVVFDNPKAAGTKSMGWVHADAFSAAVVDAGIKPLVCPTGELALFSDTPFCGKPCGGDADCPAGQACKGQANKLLPTGKAGDGVTVCTVFHAHDAGAAPPPPPPKDAAAAPPVVDAGKPATVDAGPPPPSPPSNIAADVVPAVNGACPGNFILIKKTGKCHRPCPKGPSGGECQNRPNFFCIKCDKEEKKVCGETQAQCR